MLAILSADAAGWRSCALSLSVRRGERIPAIFQQNILAIVEQYWQGGDWAAAGKKIVPLVLLLAASYVGALILGWLFSQWMAIITQGTLKKLREKMFNRMQDLPIRYFDTNNHGDIMSYYTNDIDTLRQMISQSFPQLLISGITVLVVFGIMIYYSVWLALVVVVGVAAITLITKKLGGNSAKYFVRTAKAHGQDRGLCGRDHDGAEGRQGVLSRSADVLRILTGSTTSSMKSRGRRTAMRTC